MTEYGAPERKYQEPDTGLVVTDGHVVEGYASLFGKTDQGGDIFGDCRTNLNGGHISNNLPMGWGCLQARGSQTP